MLISIGRWILAVVLLGIAVELLVRFALLEARPKKWVTLGSGFTVDAWVIASLVFRVYVTSSSVGVQADELIRKDAATGERGLFGHIRAVLG